MADDHICPGSYTTYNMMHWLLAVRGARHEHVRSSKSHYVMTRCGRCEAGAIPLVEVEGATTVGWRSLADIAEDLACGWNVADH
ncbi:hypothetical protein DOTSEDRAFT_47397, partial [Dothistroma septosporum NZE10]